MWKDCKSDVYLLSKREGIIEEMCFPEVCQDNECAFVRLETGKQTLYKCH